MSTQWRVLLTAAVLGWAVVPGIAQQGRERSERPRAEETDPAYPDQPVVPQGPVFQRRAADREDPRSAPPMQAEGRDRTDPGNADARAAPPARDPRADLPPRGQQPPADSRAGSSAAAPLVQAPIPPPTLEEEQFLDKVLAHWEKCSAKVKDFECKLVRLEYDRTHGDGNKPLYEDRGELKFVAPDRGLIVIDKPREEKWICDGKSIYQYDFRAKQVQQFKLSPEFQGQGIADGPLPFIFGANQTQLKRKYFLQITTPKDVKGDVWVRAFPRHQADARNFRSVEIILQINKDMLPSAMQVVQPNGSNYTVYLFQNVAINTSGRLNIGSLLSDDWWKPKMPGRDWQFVPDPTEAPPDRTRQPSAGRAASTANRSGQDRR